MHSYYILFLTIVTFGVATGLAHLARILTSYADASTVQSLLQRVLPTIGFLGRLINRVGDLSGSQACNARPLRTQDSLKQGSGRSESNYDWIWRRLKRVLFKASLGVLRKHITPISMPPWTTSTLPHWKSISSSGLTTVMFAVGSPRLRPT
jgi:hypothetical protein